MDMDLIILKLQKMGINHVTMVVKEGGVEVNQLFFHDPDGYMIESFTMRLVTLVGKMRSG
ncbi:putative glyoxalase/Bleomycin resistance protein/Dihydroxybiphenyl dioxygenase [Helianthus debilis subsp. tardiflorus]